MASSQTPKRKRDRLKNLFSSDSTATATSSQAPVASQAASAPPSTQVSETSNVAQPSFQDRVFQLLSQQEQDTIRNFLVPNAADMDAVMQQTLAATRDKMEICQSKRWTVTINGNRIVLREKADNIMKWLDRFKGVGDVASNVDPIHIGLPWAGIRVLLEAAISEQNQMSALLVGIETALYMSNRLQVYKSFLATLPPDQARTNFESCLVELHAFILQFLAGAIHIYQRGSIARGFKAFWQIDDVSGFENKCNGIANRVEIEASNCDRTLNTDTTRQQHETLKVMLKKLEDLHLVQQSIDKLETKLETKLDLSKLPVAAGAFYNSYQDERNAPRCHHETRKDLLQHIYKWSNDVEGECIFWLNGVAGTGKSTISRTVAEEFANRGQLGGSFFFKRGERDRENAKFFFATIVHELVRHNTKLWPPIHKSIDDDPGIAGRALTEQFRNLILQPLTDVGHNHEQTTVLVVDALDECDRDDVSVLLSLLQQLNKTSTRVFLTSRPDLPPLHGFAQMQKESHRDVILHEISTSVIKHDLSVYLEDEFKRIRVDHQSLSTFDKSLAGDWPGVEALSSLTQSAFPLFIVASTICRFVGDINGNPVKRLKLILDHPIGQRSQLEQTYLPVLSQMLIGLEDIDEIEMFCREFREIVGSIILLASPLSAIALAGLLQIEKMDIDVLLRCLQSVISVPSNPSAPIRIYHLSFREFLLKKKHTDIGQQFAIDECELHGYLADKCLVLLQNTLRKDICQLTKPGIMRDDIDETAIAKHIPLHLEYACRNWVYHLKQSGRKINDGDPVDIFLCKHFLHWIETLSLIRKNSEIIGVLKSLQSLVTEKNDQIFKLVEDAGRFISTFYHIIEQAPLQIYCSALHFSPLNSIVRKTFWDERLKAVQIRGELLKRWNARIKIYEGHSDVVSRVVFSPDGSRLASASFDGTVRIWDVETGECHQTLRGHTGDVISFDISPRGSQLASGSQDHTIRVWDFNTGDCQHTLLGHSDKVVRVNFLRPNGLQLVSCSSDNTIRLWDLRTGDCRKILGGRSSQIYTVTTSSDGLWIASSSFDSTFRLWNAQTGDCQFTFAIGNCDDMAFIKSASCPEGLQLVTSSVSGKLRVWNLQSGECQHTLQSLEGSDRLCVAVLASFGGLVVLTCEDVIQLWDMQTYECRHVMRAHEGPMLDRAKFSPNGLKFATHSSFDGSEIQIWDVQTGDCTNILQGHTSPVTSVAFSPDGNKLISGSYDKTVQSWDINANGDRSEHVHEEHTKGRTSNISCIILSTGGTRFASGSYSDYTVRIWNVKTGHCEQICKGDLHYITCVVFSPDESRIAAGSSRNGTLCIWDVKTGHLERKLERQNYYSTSHLAFSPDGSILASGSYERVLVWEIASEHLILDHREPLPGKIEEIYFCDNVIKIRKGGRLISIKIDRKLKTTAATASCNDSFNLQELHLNSVDMDADKLGIDDKWITLGTENILWLPLEYRFSRWCTRGKGVMGVVSGGSNLVYFVSTS